jgi:hypothetical protein
MFAQIPSAYYRCGTVGRPTTVMPVIRKQVTYVAPAFALLLGLSNALCSGDQMFCGECGQAIPAGFRFCGECGSAVVRAIKREAGGRIRTDTEEKDAGKDIVALRGWPRGSYFDKRSCGLRV